MFPGESNNGDDNCKQDNLGNTNASANKGDCHMSDANDSNDANESGNGGDDTGDNSNDNGCRISNDNTNNYIYNDHSISNNA